MTDRGSSKGRRKLSDSAAPTDREMKAAAARKSAGVRLTKSFHDATKYQRHDDADDEDSDHGTHPIPCPLDRNRYRRNNNIKDSNNNDNDNNISIVTLTT